MTKTAAKAKSVLIAITLALLLSATSVFTAAESATIKNGVPCKKLGQKTKTGQKSYVCGKNQYVTPQKLTWMLTSCPKAYDLYIEAKDQYGIFEDILSTSPEGLAELGNLQKSMESLDTLMRNQVCKKGK